MDINKDTRFWALVLHLSQLLTIFAFAGVIIPIVIWQVKKGDLPEIDAHGKAVVNWIISWFIYSVCFAVLSLCFIGYVLLVILFVLMHIFPIIGAIKAMNGEVWKYPLSITFLK